MKKRNSIMLATVLPLILVGCGSSSGSGDSPTKPVDQSIDGNRLPGAYIFKQSDLKSMKPMKLNGSVVLWDYTLTVDQSVSEKKAQSFDEMLSELKGFSTDKKPSRVEFSATAHFTTDKKTKFLLATNEPSDKIDSVYSENMAYCGVVTRSHNLIDSDLTVNATKLEIPFQFELCDLTKRTRVALNKENDFLVTVQQANTALKCNGSAQVLTLWTQALVYGDSSAGAHCEPGMHYQSAALISDEVTVDRASLIRPMKLEPSSTKINFAYDLINFEPSNPQSNRYVFSSTTFPKKAVEKDNFWINMENCNQAEFFVPYFASGTSQERLSKIAYNRVLSSDGTLKWNALGQSLLPTFPEYKAAGENYRPMKFNLYCKWESVNYLSTVAVY